MSKITISIPFTPKAKVSVRMGRKSIYNPSQRGMQQTRHYVKSLLPQLGGSLLSGALLVIVHFKMPIPKTIRPLQRQFFHNAPHAKRPDGDNLEKFLNDALNGIIWRDDSEISVLVRIKSQIDAPKGETHIYAKEIPDGAINYDELLQEINENIRPIQ